MLRPVGVQGLSACIVSAVRGSYPSITHTAAWRPFCLEEDCLAHLPLHYKPRAATSWYTCHLSHQTHATLARFTYCRSRVQVLPQHGTRITLAWYTCISLARYTCHHARNTCLPAPSNHRGLTPPRSARWSTRRTAQLPNADGPQWYVRVDQSQDHFYSPYPNACDLNRGLQKRPTVRCAVIYDDIHQLTGTTFGRQAATCDQTQLPANLLWLLFDGRCLPRRDYSCLPCLLDSF